MRKLSIATALAISAMPIASVALADRPVSPEERQHVGEVLRAHGFVSWSKIERDDGRWEVDDAVTGSGKVYDVDIANGRVVDWDRD